MDSIMLISQMPDKCHVLECHQNSLNNLKYFTLSIKESFVKQMSE